MAVVVEILLKEEDKVTGLYIILAFFLKTSIQNLASTNGFLTLQLLWFKTKLYPCLLSGWLGLS